MRRKADDVLRSGTVTHEHAGKVYTARYDVLRGGVVRLQTGHRTQAGGMKEEQIARVLLREIVRSGRADEEGLGRPKRE